MRLCMRLSVWDFLCMRLSMYETICMMLSVWNSLCRRLSCVWDCVCETACVWDCVCIKKLINLFILFNLPVLIFQYKASLVSDFAKLSTPLFVNGTFRPIIYKVYPLSEIAQAHILMESNENLGKIVLKIRDDDTQEK